MLHDLSMTSKGERTWTAELQTMLGVTASMVPAALRFSCHLLFSAKPPSRIAYTGTRARTQPSSQQVQRRDTGMQRQSRSNTQAAKAVRTQICTWPGNAATQLSRRALWRERRPPHRVTCYAHTLQARWGYMIR